MVHITNKHQTSMMTPEVKLKTGCVVGGASENFDDWDDHMPDTSVKTTGKVVGEFFVSAVGGLSRYG